jgi:pyruvate kinase
MRRERKTKIVATLGPASNAPEIMAAMFEAGADVFRINMSHTPHDLLKRMHRDLRELSQARGRPIGILVDLQGPKIRLGVLKDGPRELKEGEKIRLVLAERNERADEVPIPHPEIFQAIKQKHALLIDDGKVRLRLTKRADAYADAVVVVGGVIKDRKGVNMPDTLLAVSAITPKDRADLDAALALGVDWVALSFVQRPDDIAEVKKIVAGRAGVLAKIEKPKALACLDHILELCDALMVARGDLGVELPLEAVPGLQKQITRAARKAGKPVVVATQMLESMIQSSTPTRAEVSDVATAVYDGADAVMLSAESAAGAYPVEAVTMMDHITAKVESDVLYQSLIEAQRNPPEATTADAIMAAMHAVTETIQARAIICWTQSGSTALRAARERARAPIIALTPSIETARRLCLVWGLHCLTADEVHNLDEMVDHAVDFAQREGFAGKGDRVVITGGVPLGVTGTTNMLRVAVVGAR